MKMLLRKDLKKTFLLNKLTDCVIKKKKIKSASGVRDL